MRPAWILAGALGLLAGGASGGSAAAPARTVTCRLSKGAEARVYRLEQRGAGGTWTLSMQSASSGEAWVRLALPGAVPSFGDGTATLRYHNANGGRQIALEVTPGGSRLDVYVDYGLDVNIDPNLDPAVDTMNTNGAVTAVDCTIATP